MAWKRPPLRKWPELIVKQKVLAYITNGRRLLLFRHPESPEAGIQVPAGTLEAGESPEEGVLREAYEETGLSGLTLVSFLGNQHRNLLDFGRAEIHQRWFYHLACPGNPPAEWRHFETDPSDGSPGPIPFDFFWAEFPHEVPQLVADHDFMFPQLQESLNKPQFF